MMEQKLSETICSKSGVQTVTRLRGTKHGVWDETYLNLSLLAIDQSDKSWGMRLLRVAHGCTTIP